LALTGGLFGMSQPETRTVANADRIAGVVRAPGDKSISHRAVMLAGLADGESVVRGFLEGEDCLCTAAALQRLGAEVERRGETLRIRGAGGRFRDPGGALDLGNSGTSMRLLAGLVAGQPFATEMTGDASLRSRPMRRIKEPLERMGAAVELLGPNGCAPIRVRGARLAPIEYPLPVASAQVKSCVLLAGLFARGVTTVIEPERTRDHTERMLRACGVTVETQGGHVAVHGAADGVPRLRARDWDVPGDVSSAAFWMVAAACRPGGDVAVERIGLNPTRTAVLDVLRRMGTCVEVRADPADTAGDVGEPVGRIRVTGRGLRATEIGGAEIPNLIDELPVLTVAAALAEGRTVIRDARELRVKESDRIATTCAMLRAFGVRAEERPDGMAIEGPARIRGGVTIDSRGDHRIAMTGAILALLADRPATIRDTACIATSYPTFWTDLARLTGKAAQA
jgi:3-phosphoshikimate 1-carboxyvinyltransferase